MPDPTPSPSSKHRLPLTRERILVEAVAFADEEGIAAVSMRRLASRLGFEVMSLYNHVANKDDLQQGMVDIVVDEISLADSPGDWRAAIRQHAIDTRKMFVRHPWAAVLWMSIIPGPKRFDLMEWELRTLGSTGLDEVAAHHAFHAITTHVTGYSLQASLMKMDELGTLATQLTESLDAERYEYVVGHIKQHVDGDHGPSFEFVLDLLLDGIAALDASARPTEP